MKPKAPDGMVLLTEALLNDIEEYLDDRADASAEGDPLEYRPNKAMNILTALRDELGR